MLGEAVKAFTVPTEILHDLGGEFHKVPGDIHPIEGFDFHVAQQMMQQVPELVKHGLYLGMRKEGRLAIDRRRHIPTNQTKMRLPVAPAGGRQTSFEIVHPCSAALGIAGVPICVKRAEVSALGVVDFVELDLRVPDFDSSWTIS